MRRCISTNITWVRYIFGIITLFLLHDIFHLLIAHLNFTLRVETELIAVLITGVSYYYFRQRKTVEYDHEFLYLIWKKKVTKIPLTEIKKVRLTWIKLNNKDTWKIDYRGNKGLDKNVRFIPNKSKPSYFEDFKTHIDKINHEVTIENIAESF